MTLDFGNNKMPPGRALLALVIVLGHFSYFGIDALRPLRNLAPPAVALFLFISGYGLMKSFQKKGDVYLQAFLQRRLFKILVPALLVYVLHLLLCGGDSAGLPGRVVLVFTNGDTLLPHYWFVWAIVFDYLLFWICFKFLRGDLPRFAVLAGTLLFTVATVLAGFDRCWWVCSLAFPSGLFLAEYDRDLFSFCSRKELNYWLVLLAAGLAFGICYLTGNPYVWTLCYVFVPLVGALLIARIPLDRLRLPVLGFLGSISYEIYLIHITAMTFLRGGSVRLDSSPLFITAVLAFTLGAAFGIHFLCTLTVPGMKKAST